MLFNSYIFLILYLPVIIFVFFRLGRYSQRLAAAWMAAASLFFYGYWNPAYVGLLLLSVIFNYGTGYVLAREYQHGVARRRHLILALGVGVDLILLGYYKYADFVMDTSNRLLETHYTALNILLPLGISFFTFTQIAFLVDAWSGKASEYRFIHYLLFVTYFPHLIAGPVLHHKEMMPQFSRPETYRLSWDNMTVGLSIFSIGLFKKTVLADGISPYANSVFSAAEAGQAVDFFGAWGGALAYSVQLYFDFSGYSDMAIGLSRLFGIILPLNFNSPYKAKSIIDFWRRWHMSLSRFLRDYLYIPLGGNRKGPCRRYLNLMATMLLGGLWHGASWNFVLWGGLHGCYLIVNQAWIALRAGLMPSRSGPGRWERLAGWALTFTLVVVAWVFFRAASLDSALNLLKGMLGLQSFCLPSAIAPAIGPLAEHLRIWGIEFVPGGGGQFVYTWIWTTFLLAIALLLPNSQEFMRAHHPGLDFDPGPARVTLQWTLTARWAWAMALLACAGILSLSRASEFLYYQF